MGEYMHAMESQATFNRSLGLDGQPKKSFDAAIGAEGFDPSNSQTKRWGELEIKHLQNDKARLMKLNDDLETENR